MGLLSPNDLTVHDIESFLLDMVQRFAPDNELEDVLGPVVRGLLFHGCLFRPEGIAATDSQWRGSWRVGGVSDTQIDCVYDNLHGRVGTYGRGRCRFRD